MRNELTQKLYDVFPMFFTGWNDTEDGTHYYISLDCGDGWFDIIYKMCLELEEIIKISPDDKDFRFLQIKEKFAGLRAYYTGYVNPKIDDIVCDAEDESYKICEICGREGKERVAGMWVMTRCDFCWSETLKQRD
jgi:hypothetical protein